MKILLTEPSTKVGPFQLGVVETPMWPAKYYAGWIAASGQPATNHTGYFRTQSEALDEYMRLLERC